MEKRVRAMPQRLLHRTSSATTRGRPSLLAQLAVAAALLTACTTAPPATVHADPDPAPRGQAVLWLDRVTWGANDTSARELATLGEERYLAGQLKPAGDALAAPVQATIAGFSVSKLSLEQLVLGLEEQRKSADAIANDDDKKAAQQAYQQALTKVANEAAARSLLRDLYSPNQLREQMTWFWMNHFNVFLYKGNLRAMVGDFEDHAIRPHALGRFRDLLVATMRHPAMLRYLDNEQNAAGHINENYARELMELHTLGVDGGYSQKDVQELARVLTGLGVNATGKMSPVKPPLQAQYVRQGLFEFNPARHDYGDKQLLGRTIHGRGIAEIYEVADLLAKQPATAHFVSRKLAVFFVADDPPQALVERMARTFRQSDGDIAATLATLFHSPEFTASLGHKFKDPVHYAVSAVRLAYGDKPILNANPILGWLNRMGEPLYGRLTPDGYPLTAAAWASPGQMVARFEVARTIGMNSAGLFKTDAPDAVELPAFPQLANALYYTTTANRLDVATHEALDQSKSPQEWNMFLLASPEFMHR
jgi:uncharacterized protein (DUF1800 family)